MNPNRVIKLPLTRCNVLCVTPVRTTECPGTLCTWFFSVTEILLPSLICVAAS